MARSIRRASVADAHDLARVGARTFIDAFGHLYGPEDLQAFLQWHHTPEACATLLSNPACAVWLLEDEGEVIGYSLAGPCGLPHPDATPQDGELKRLYLLREAQNGGWGGRLFETALAWLEHEGPRTLWISVWSENLGAQRFYARYGFEKAGEYEFIVGKQRDREFMFRRDGSSV